ncbi:MAG: O-antigen ligase family protein, partial [Acidobacteriota bacterium]
WLDGRMISQIRTYGLTSHALVALAFIFPFSVSASSALSGLLIALWILEGDFKAKFEAIRSNRITIAFLLFFALHLVGMLWTEDVKWGLHTLAKYWKLLLVPVVLTTARKEHLRRYLWAFILSMTVLVAISYMSWLHLISVPSILAEDPTPFMSHIPYNVLLAFAIYLVLCELIFSRPAKAWLVALLVFLAAAMTVDMFITGGRAGQLGFLALLTILFFQYYNRSIVKPAALAAVIIPLTLVISYQFSPTFRARVIEGWSEIQGFKTNPDTSVGKRLAFYINSMEIIGRNPILGVGTGDFPREYQKVNQVNSPSLPDTVNPHNQFILMLVQFGIAGLPLLIAIFYLQARSAFQTENILIRYPRLALPVLFGVVMLTDTYLIVHQTAIMFYLFSGIVYKDYDGPGYP